MDLNTLKLLVKDQFPEVYRTEYTQLIAFVTKYYEFLNTSEYSILSTIRDVDTSLDEYVKILKTNFAINIPEFGKLPDRDFLRFAKQFYTSRGSEDSYKFLFRAMFGKEVEILYPGENVLKPSDGIWSQELSIRVSTNSDPSIITNKLIDIIASNGSKTIVECTRTKRITDTVFDIFIKRNYREIINIGDTVSYDNFKPGSVTSIIVSNGGSGYTQGSPVAFSLAPNDGTTAAGTINVSDGVIKSITITDPGSGYTTAPTVSVMDFGANAVLTAIVEEPKQVFSGTIIPTPSKLKIINNGINFVAGTLFTAEHDLPLRFRINKTDINGVIEKIEIVQPGFDLFNKKYFLIDSATKLTELNENLYSPQTYTSDSSPYFLESGLNQYSKGDQFVPTSTQALLELEYSSLLKYPGVYTSSNGFLSDAIKLHDNSYHQSYSYVIRLDEQLESYKNVVKRLLHPSGMALWAEYNMSTQIDIKSAIDTLRAILELFVEDDLFPIDDKSFDYNLSLGGKNSYAYTYNPITGIERYFEGIGAEAYCEDEDTPVALDDKSFDIGLARADNVEEQPDNGLLTITLQQDYCEADYFAEFGVYQYICLNDTIEPQTYSSENYFAEIGAEAYCIGNGEQYRILYSGIPRPVDDYIDVVPGETGQVVLTDQFGNIIKTSQIHSGRVRPVDDDIFISEQLTFDSIKSETDSVSATDNLDRVVDYNPSLGDIISTTDTLLSTSEFIRGFSDSTQVNIDQGQLLILTPQDYSSEGYFVENESDIYALNYAAEDYFLNLGNEVYTTGEDTVIRILYAGIPRPVDDYSFGTDQGQLIIATPQDYSSEGYFLEDYSLGEDSIIRLLYAGIPRPVDEEILIEDQFNSTSEFIRSFEHNIAAVEDQFNSTSEFIRDNVEITSNSDQGQLLILTPQDYSSEGYFVENESDIYALDYASEDYFLNLGNEVYTTGEDSIIRVLYSGIPRPVDDVVSAIDEIIVSRDYFIEDSVPDQLESGSIELKYEDIYALDYFAEINAEAYSIGTEAQSRVIYSGIARPVDDQVITEELVAFDSIFNKEDASIVVDTGNILYQTEQTFSSEGYFQSSGADAYSMGDDSYYEDLVV